MYKKILSAGMLLLASSSSFSQQFIGLNIENITIQHLPNNPAWVVNSKSGLEINLASASGLAGTNAYYFERKYLAQELDTKAIEGDNYDKDNTESSKKHLWGNIEVLGPAVSFTIKKEHHIGVYTRMRQIARGGNVSKLGLSLLGGSVAKEDYGKTIDYNNTGFTTHTFGEVGFSYGRTLYNDDYHILKGGITLKYLMGFAAASIYSESFEYNQKNQDTIGSAKGDISMQYSYNYDSYVDSIFSNDISSWFTRAGKGSIGFDIGVQYEYHPNGTPNNETPYTYSIAVSITDIGSITYIADTGSGLYNVNVTNINNNAIGIHEAEPINNYLFRLTADSLLSTKDEKTKFKVGLPTALRINTDWNINERMNIAVNILLNLRGDNNKQGIYRSAYVNYFNITPAYKAGKIRIGLPITYMGFQNLGIGLMADFGPFFIGSNSAISSIMTERMRNADIYAGIVYKFKNKK